MASGRSSLMMLCVCSLLVVVLVGDVTLAADVQQQQPATGITVSTAKFHLRGNLAGEVAEESFESFERRELSDYGRNPASANCKVNCKR